MRKDYRNEAEQHPEIFRNILKDMKERCPICPKDFDPKEPIQKIFEKYSRGNICGQFKICDFAVGPKDNGLVKLAEGEAMIDVEDIAFLSGEGYSVIYKFHDDNSIEFNRFDSIRMS